MTEQENFEKAIVSCGKRVRDILKKLPPKIQNNVQEIRLRLNNPLALTVLSDTVFVRQNGEISFFITSDLVYITPDDIEESFSLICENSVYAHEREIKYGFITLKNGGRAGLCGKFSKEGYLTDITSINIRIAREVLGCANKLSTEYKGKGLLIAGPAGSGKTTVLRDFLRQQATFKSGKFKRIVLIDSRGEVSGYKTGGYQNDLGQTTDVIFIEDKAQGVSMALRTMFPEMIAFDEIGNNEEFIGVRESFFSGVEIVTTAHIGEKNELLQRTITKNLLIEGIVSQVAILPKIPSSEITLFNTKELIKCY